MKAFLFTLTLAVCTFANMPSASAYVVSPNNSAAAYEEASASKALSAKELKKQQKKELRAQKRAERRARFIAWITKKLSDDNDQIVAILLAFFVGWLGIHRLYLKSDPIIILWYVITLGGFFGLIPLIDFIRLILGQVDHYRGNSSLFRAFESAS